MSSQPVRPVSSQRYFPVSSQGGFAAEHIAAMVAAKRGSERQHAALGRLTGQAERAAQLRRSAASRCPGQPWRVGCSSGKQRS